MPKHHAAKKADRIVATRPKTLPELPAGSSWTELAIRDHSFAAPTADSVSGALALCKGNEALVCDMFNRGLHIAIPARLKARERFNKTSDANKTAEDVQREILTLDVATLAIRTRQPAKTVDEKALAAAMKTGKLENVRAVLEAAGIKMA